MIKSSQFHPSAESKSASRTRKNWKADSRGYFSRQIGWERSKSGKVQQHKFLLGKDRQQAEWRERKLREIWDRFANSSQEKKPFWPLDLLEIAKLIAKGVEEIAVVPYSGETPLQYADRIQGIQSDHPVVLFVPADRYKYDVGVAANHCLGQIPVEPGQLNYEALARQHAAGRVDLNAQVDPRFASPVGYHQPQSQPHPISLPSAHRPPRRIATGVVDSSLIDPNTYDDHLMSEFPQFHSDPHAVLASTTNYPIQNSSQNQDCSSVGYTTPKQPAPTKNKQTLYDAIEAYQEFVRREFYRPELERLTNWGHTQVKQMNTLKKHHKNRLLAHLNSDGVNELIGYWRRRPAKTGTKKPMTAKSASNYLSALIRFLKWLHTSSRFEWEKPFAFNDINTRVQKIKSDHANRKLDQVETFSLAELKLLMRYSLPLDRVFLLLALNCGFGRAETSTLLINEIVLFTGHSDWHCELMNYRTTAADSFIKRIRRKSGVYGEHLLFEMTVKAIQWAIKERRQQPDYSENACLLLNKNGKPFDHPTEGGNSNQTIPNRLARTIKRIQKDGHEIRNLSFGKLRKTAGQMIKTFSDGEVMGVFECHGKPVESDERSF